MRHVEHRTDQFHGIDALVQHCDCLDFQQPIWAEQRSNEGRASRIRLLEKLLANSADFREIGAIPNDRCNFHYVIHFGACRRKHAFNVSEDLTCLRLGIVLTNELALFIKRDLSGDVDGALTLRNKAQRVRKRRLINLRRC